MIALTMILKSLLVDPMMLNVSAINSNNKLPTITGDDLRIAPTSSNIIVLQVYKVSSMHGTVIGTTRLSRNGERQRKST